MVFHFQFFIAHTVADNDLLAAQLPNLIEYHIVEYEGWSHLDFCFGMDAATLVYDKILAQMSTMK